MTELSEIEPALKKEPEVGDIVVTQKYGLHVRQILKVSPAQIRMRGEHGTHTYAKSDPRILAIISPSDVGDLDTFRQSLGGISGEHDRRVRAAQIEHKKRVASANEALKKSLVRLIKKRRESAI